MAKLEDIRARLQQAPEQAKDAPDSGDGKPDWSNWMRHAYPSAGLNLPGDWCPHCRKTQPTTLTEVNKLKVIRAWTDVAYLRCNWCLYAEEWAPIIGSDCPSCCHNNHGHLQKLMSGYSAQLNANVVFCPTCDWRAYQYPHLVREVIDLEEK